MRFWVYGLMIAVLCVGCDSSDATPQSPKLAPPKPNVDTPPIAPPTPKKATTFESEDGASLAGDLYISKPEAPAVVMVHRLHAQRVELTPLAERLATAEKRFTVLNFDLRGHGESKPPEKDKKGPGRFEADVHAAIAHVVKATKGKVPRIVLVGSSFGATLVAVATKTQAKVTALALLSPGAAIEGLDIYVPYAEVRDLPTFISGAVQDNVSKAPFESLSKMAKRDVAKQYPGSRHSAGHLAAEHPALWTDVTAWLMTQYEEKPSERIVDDDADDKDKKP